MSSKSKILFICESKVVSGAEFVLGDYLQESALAKQSIVLIPPLEKVINFFKSKPLNRVVSQKKLLPARLLHSVRPLALLKKAYNYSSISRSFRKLGKQESIRICVGSNSIDTLYSKPVKKALGLPYYQFIHDILLPGTPLSLVVKRNAAYVDLFLAVSKAVEEGLLALGIPQSKIQVIYNGLAVNPEENLADRSQEGVIGFVGSLEERKSPLSFPKFLKALAKTDYPLKKAQVLFKIADSKTLEALKEEIRDCPISVELIQGSTREETLDFYRSWDFLFVPSIFDPLPTVILEAFREGTPVIGRKASGIPEMVEDSLSGFLFDRDEDLETLAERLSAQSAGDWSSMRHHARKQLLERFSLKKKVQTMDELLGEG